jgi:hypothetical protein
VLEGWRSVGELTQWGFAHAPDLGWSLWAYDPEEVPAGTDPTDPASLLTMEYTNRRDREQARNLSRLVTDAPGEPLLVWSGGRHAAKVPAGEWVTMGCHFPGMSGVEAFVIDQTVTWTGRAGRSRG